MASAGSNYNLGSAMVKKTPAGIAGSATKEAPAAGTVQRIEIEIADNGGFTVRCYMKPSNSKKGNMDIGYMEPSKHVFSTKDELDAYLDDTLGTGDDSGESGENE